MGNLDRLLSVCKTEEEFVEKWKELHPFQGKIKPYEEYLTENLAHSIDQEILAKLFWTGRKYFLREIKLKRIING